MYNRRLKQPAGRGFGTVTPDGLPVWEQPAACTSLSERVVGGLDLKWAAERVWTSVRLTVFSLPELGRSGLILLLVG